jgi:hypothetical protein
MVSKKRTGKAKRKTTKKKTAKIKRRRSGASLASGKQPKKKRPPL